MVYQYLSGRRPLSLLTGVRFASGLGVELRSISPRLAAELELALKVLPQQPSITDQTSEYARVQCVQLELRGGKRTYNIRPLGTDGAFIAFRHDWLKLRNYESSWLLAVRVNDDAMRPTMAHGDMIVINTADRSPTETVVFAVNYEGELYIRRFVRDIGAWWLVCDNPDVQRFPRKQFNEKQCYIIGRVIHRQSEII